MWTPIVPPQSSDVVVMESLDNAILEMDRRWVLCCVEVDRELVQCIVEIVFTLLVSTFCMIQLHRLHDCESQQLYSGILTFIIGIVIPQPTMIQHRQN
jgi:hypothetical protein